MTSVEMSNSSDLRIVTKSCLQEELLNMPHLPEGSKGMMTALFNGKTQATDGDTFVTFKDPSGGFFTVDVNGGGDLLVAWHEKNAMEKGSVEAISVGVKGHALYRRHAGENDGRAFDTFKIGEEAIPLINSFRDRRLHHT